MRGAQCRAGRVLDRVFGKALDRCLDKDLYRALHRVAGMAPDM